MFDFKVTGCANPGTASVQVVYPQALPAGSQYWKYGPTPGPVAAHWYALEAGAPSNFMLTGNTVSFTITDGGLGDDDLLVNGTISDQGGIGIPATPGEVTPVPTLGELGMMMLFGLLALAGLTSIRVRGGRR
jgi:hypothetical protein